MKRIAATLLATVMAACLLTGCATGTLTIASSSDPDSSQSEASRPVNLTDEKVIAELCDTKATDVVTDLQPLVDAKADSGKRNQLKDWGIKDPSNKKAVQKVLDALKERQDTPCKDLTKGETIGVVNHDGTTGSVLTLAGEPGKVSVLDTTNDPQTPPLFQSGNSQLLGGKHFVIQVATWSEVPTKVGKEEWYKGGVNSFASKTGFSWDDVLKAAEVNKLADDGKIMNSALALQIINSSMTTEEAIASLPKEFKDQLATLIDGGINAIPVQRLDTGMMNTRNVGTQTNPIMGEFLDQTEQVRVTLMPIKFDKEFCGGKDMCLDGSRGAGIFIDCLNVHWVPLAKWTCTDAACTIPPCPAGWFGTQPNCIPPCVFNSELPNNSPDCVAPPEVCPPGMEGTPPDCWTPKDWTESVENEGWTPMQVGELTDGQGSQNQQESGETKGNVTDNKVPEDTKSGDTTPDTNKGDTTAPGATDGGDDQTKGGKDTEHTNQDPGGTDGDTCVPDGVVVLTCP